MQEENGDAPLSQFTALSPILRHSLTSHHFPPPLGIITCSLLTRSSLLIGIESGKACTKHGRARAASNNKWLRQYGGWHAAASAACRHPSQHSSHLALHTNPLTSNPMITKAIHTLLYRKTPDISAISGGYLFQHSALYKTPLPWGV